MRDILKKVTTGSMIAGAALIVAACGGGPAAPPAGDQTPSEAGAPAPSTVEQVSVGTVSFSVDGQGRTFEHLPSGNNVYTPVSSSILARPSADAVEQLTITFLSMNLRSMSFPAELPLPRDPGNVMSAMANVGFSYTSAGGDEWAGPGRIRVESFASDGVVAGSFTGVSLPHTDKQAPDVTLTDGTFRARISAPW